MPKHKRNNHNNKPNKRPRLKLIIPSRYKYNIIKQLSFSVVHPIRNLKTNEYKEQETYQRWGFGNKFKNNRRKRSHVRLKIPDRIYLLFNHTDTEYKILECELYHGSIKCKCKATRFLCEFDEFDEKLLCPDCAMYENIVSRRCDKSRFNQLKNTKFGSEYKKCYCCEYPKINDDNFHAGHAKSHKDNGKVSCDNLRPICYDCNSSMKDKHMLRYMYENNLNWPKLYDELYTQNVSDDLINKSNHMEELIRNNII